jgi:formylglycine-generating enzyme required for sulfatase activity
MANRSGPVSVQLVLVFGAFGCGAEVEPGAPSAPTEQPRAVAEESAPDTADDASPAPTVRTEIPDDMLGVPGGTFTMGADKVGEPDEQPAHDVTLRPFLLDRTEVTNSAYGECVDAGVCRERKRPCVKGNRLEPEKAFLGHRQPVSCVSRDDAAIFCRWRVRRLPSEAEWERAARGSDGRRYPWGEQRPDEQHAVFHARVTEPVGSRPSGAGPYGHLDLAGNVWEWLADRYDPFAYRRKTAGQGVPGDCQQILRTQELLRHEKKQGFTGSNPIPTECEFCLRGGAFNYGGGGLRSSNRVHHPGDWRIIMAGFRCAADWPDGPVE